MSPKGTTRAILSPALDLLCVGGLSLLVFIPLLASGTTDLLMIGVGTQAVLATMINMPHFMASYRIVYRSREMILRHKWASIYIPAILLMYIVVAVWEAQSSLFMVTILVTVSGTYLAWHYTGQVWGMMASYAHVEGTAFDQAERTLIRTSLRILLAWHVTWFLYTKLRDPSVVQPLYAVISAGTVVAFVLGAVGILRMRRRTGVFPPLRALVAWIAIFVWYAMVARDPNAIFWVQIAHAVQYLAFPIRVEINRAQGDAQSGARGFVQHMVLYAIVLLAASYLAGEFFPARAMDAVGVMFGADASKVTPVLLLIFVNIHHYFTDGVIWKVSDPEVRKDVFAHLPVAIAAIPADRLQRGSNSRANSRVP